MENVGSAARASVVDDSRERREPDYGRLQNLIRDDILSGKLPGGARLKVTEIAAAYGTSTNPAREALRGLEGEGLVNVSPNRGATVRVIDEALISNIFDIRDMIEPHIVRYFAETAFPSDIEQLELYQAGCAKGERSESYALFHSNNTKFHDYIIDKYSNKEAVKIMRTHTAWLRAFNRQHPMQKSEMQRSNKEHAMFINAVHAGDVDLAVAIMHRHRQNARRLFLYNISLNLGDAHSES